MVKSPSFLMLPMPKPVTNSQPSLCKDFVEIYKTRSGDTLH